MIQFDCKQGVYTCPFCGRVQALNNSSFLKNRTGLHSHEAMMRIDDETCAELNICNIRCSNQKCRKITVLAMDYHMSKRVCDIIPKKVIRQFPEYIPQQIRQDYEEATSILNDSPKAAATLYRRCLQGMIRDFWEISKGRLIDEIKALEGKIPAMQWKAIEGLRKIGNIGAHMESDVNMIVDIDEGEAEKLGRLIELLMEKWYIARHDEETLLQEISAISEEKQEERKGAKASRD